jgi:alpha-galactosidase
MIFSRLHITALTVAAALTMGWGSIEAADKPLKIFILVGQSNMQGHAKEATLAGMAMDPISKPLYDKFVDENGKVRVHDHIYIAAFSRTDSWGKIGDTAEKHGKLTIGYGSNTHEPDKFGPEMGFGVTMYESLNEPILIIKTSWGGKSLKQDFRPPSGGPYYKSADEVKDRVTNKGETITAAEEIAQKAAVTGKYYRLMLEHVKAVLAEPGKYYPAYDPKVGYEIAGFAWFQGFNDLVGPYPPANPSDNKKGNTKDFSEYSMLLACFIRDVRKDLSVPNLPFAIGVLGIGGNRAQDNTASFRKAMAAPAELEEFKGNVVAVHTADFWDDKLDELVSRTSVLSMKKGKQATEDADDKYAELKKKLAPLQEELEDIEGGVERNMGKIKELKQKINDAIYSPEEQEYIAKNKSNQGYHYMGSGKIYSRIGEALAKALMQLNKETNQ